MPRQPCDFEDSAGLYLLGILLCHVYSTDFFWQTAEWARKQGPFQLPQLSIIFDPNLQKGNANATSGHLAIRQRVPLKQEAQQKPSPPVELEVGVIFHDMRRREVVEASSFSAEK
eukprot:symbB.v1.2.018631.t1/scaffold1441.1/size118624/3